METIQQQLAEAKRNELKHRLKEAKLPSKQFGFAADLLKGSSTEG